MTSQRTIDVFIENPKGAIVKIHHDEQALLPSHCELVGAPFVYAYGFVVGVPSGDGDMLDCFVLSERVLYTGDRIACIPFGYLEQWQNELEDFNILAVPADEAETLATIDLAEVHRTLDDFCAQVFIHDPGRTLRVGEVHGAQEAYDYIDNLLNPVNSASGDPHA